MELHAFEAMAESLPATQVPLQTTVFPAVTPPGMAYVPFQEEDAKIFSPDQGYALGTMYYALNKPFYGSKCGDADD